MAWSVTADPGRFDEAVEWFRSKTPLTEAEFERLSEDAQDGAFTLAGVQQLDIIQDVFDEITRSLVAGEAYGVFRKRVREKLTGDWASADSARLLNTYRTNVQTAYNTGRWFQQQDPDVAALRPWMLFDGVQDDRQTEICRELDPEGGPPTIVRHDDPYVYNFWPPLHHSCRSQWRSISERKAREMGVSVDPPVPDAQEGFGKAPPIRSSWKPRESDYAAQLWDAYVSKQEEFRL